VSARLAEKIDDAAALAGIVDVSDETIALLTRLVDLVAKWQPAENLVAASTLPTIWRRHVADSAQLVPLFPDVRRWLDLGSGAGFPGLVVAILIAGRPGAAVHLVESNSRKSAFLRLAVRETGAPAIVHEGRIETVLARFAEPVEMVTARALAPLVDLFGMAEPLIARGARAAFHKGRDFKRETVEASQSWDSDLIEHRSAVDDSSVILEVRRVERKQAFRRGPT
jgi:16S rRNA (guanine527-N7)-methyltransferase